MYYVYTPFMEDKFTDIFKQTVCNPTERGFTMNIEQK
jgi:hypothetical protein